MSFSKIYTQGLLGLHAPLIEVEVHVSQGLPSLTIVGLAEAAVRESKDRVRSAIINSGFQFPTKRLTINLAPADLPKDGSRLDLPIALGILIASGQLPENCTEDFEFIGELALDGHVRPVSGALTLAMACQQAQHKIVLPVDNSQDISHLPNLECYPVNHLKEVCEHFLGTQKLAHAQPSAHSNEMPYKFDLADVKGQLRPRRALEIAAAGDIPCSLKDHQAQVKLYWPHACLPFYRHFLLEKLLKLQVFILFQIHHILLGSVHFARPTIQHQQLHWLGAVVSSTNKSEFTQIN